MDGLITCIQCQTQYIPTTLCLFKMCSVCSLRQKVKDMFPDMLMIEDKPNPIWEEVEQMQKEAKQQMYDIFRLTDKQLGIELETDWDAELRELWTKR